MPISKLPSKDQSKEQLRASWQSAYIEGSNLWVAHARLPTLSNSVVAIIDNYVFLYPSLSIPFCNNDLIRDLGRLQKESHNSNEWIDTYAEEIAGGINYRILSELLGINNAEDQKTKIAELMIQSKNSRPLLQKIFSPDILTSSSFGRTEYILSEDPLITKFDIYLKDLSHSKDIPIHLSQISSKYFDTKIDPFSIQDFTYESLDAIPAI